MVFDVQTQRALLTLVGVERKLLQATHRQEVISGELAGSAGIDQQFQSTKDTALAQQMRIEDIDSHITKAEKEIAMLGERLSSDMDHHTVLSDAKAKLEAHHEHNALNRRKGLLEDVLSELQQERTELISSVETIASQVHTVQQQQRDRATHLSEEAARLHQQAQELGSQRGAILASIAPKYANLYAFLQAQHKNPVGIFSGNSCSACGMELDRGSVEIIKQSPANTLLRCPECEAILIKDNPRA